MEYYWYLSQLDRSEHSVTLESDSGYDFSNLIDDINLLNSLALQHSVASSDVEVEDPSTGVVTMSFTFPTESNWENFCKAFLSVKSEETSDESR